MMATTHVATGLFITVATAAALHLPFKTSILFAFAGVIGSLLPDIDHPKSWLGRRIPFISIPLSMLVGHRGITHSLVALLASLFFSAYALSVYAGGSGVTMVIATGLCLGYGSHLLGDFASNSGIPVFWPSKKRYKLPIVLFTGSWEESIIAVSLWLGAAYLYLKCFL